MVKKATEQPSSHLGLRRLAHILGFVFALLATGVIAGFVLNSLYMLRSADFLKQTDLAIENSYQSQKLAELAVLIDTEPEGPAREKTRERFARTLAEMQSTYQRLLAGDEAQGIPPLPDELKQYIYGPLDTYDGLFKAFVREAEGYLIAHQAGQPAALEGGGDHIDMIVSWANGPLASAQEHLVSLMQRHAAREFRSLWIVHALIFGLTLLLLAVGGFILLRKLLLQTAVMIRDHGSAERRLVAIIDSVEDGILEVNPDGGIVFANRSALRILGQGADGSVLSSLQEMTRLAGNDGNRVLFALGRMEKASATTILLSRPDGTCFRAALTLMPIEGQPRAIVSFRDVTRHLHREERLRKLSHAVENSPAPVIITDFTGVIEYVNPAFTTVSGWHAKEVIGHSPRMISSGEERGHMYRDMWAQLRAGQSWRGEFRNRRKDGGAYWVRSAIAPIIDDTGSITHFVAVQEDVTTEVQALQELQTSRRRLREAIDSLPQGFAIYNADETLSMCNDAYRGMYGVGASGIQEGMPFEAIVRVGLEASIFRHFASAEEKEAFVQKRLALFRAGGEQEIELGSGRWILASETITPSGAHVGLRADITDIKRIQQELENARSRADQANQAKSRFLSSMSHELRTPLNAILGFAQLLQMNRKTPLNERQSDQVKQILGAGHHLLELIDEILDLAKIEAGTVPLQMGPVDVCAMVADCQALIQPAVDLAGLTMDVTTPERAGQWVFADHVRLKQILLNLLSNAVKYNRPQGKLWLNTELVAPDTDEQKGGRVIFAVSDTGLGIPEEMRNELFQPFNRLGRDSLMVEGTGIGLALTKQLVELMGADLAVSNIPSGGTCFSFTLPVTEPPVLVEQRSS